MSAGQERPRREPPVLLAELLSWIRAFGPYRWASNRFRDWGVGGRTAVIGLPYLWLVLFFLIPFIIVLKISVSDIRLGMPPYEPLLHWVEHQVATLRINLGNYAFLFEDPLYRNAYLNSIFTAASATVLCLLIGYPMAYGIARTSPSWRNLLGREVLGARAHPRVRREAERPPHDRDARHAGSPWGRSLAGVGRLPFEVRPHRG